jgi:hypothetical protein
MGMRMEVLAAIEDAYFILTVVVKALCCKPEGCGFNSR